jgi:hypothetical protein
MMHKKELLTGLAAEFNQGGFTQPIFAANGV